MPAARAWAAEAAGTALLVWVILVAVGLALGADSPVARALPGPGARFLPIPPPRIWVIIETPTSPIARRPIHTGTWHGSFAPSWRASSGSHAETDAGSSVSSSSSGWAGHDRSLEMRIVALGHCSPESSTGQRRG
jgi:hypothetical protein